MKCTTRLALLATASLTTCALLAPIASAKTTKVTINATANDPTSFTNISSKLSGSLGKGTQGKCCLKLPKSYYVWKFKGGTIIAVGTSALNGSNVTGTWKITKGKSKGRFKGATGGGKFTGDLPSGKYVFKGAVKY